ncbi:hypothetical protein LQK93_03753 [Terrabacter sp. BE26]
MGGHELEGPFNAWLNEGSDRALCAKSAKCAAPGYSLSGSSRSLATDCLALLAIRRSRYDGLYKAPDGPQVSYLSFGAPLEL